MPTWGEPEIANSSPMQGPSQINAAARYARDVGVRRFANRSALQAALNVPGADPAPGMIVLLDSTPGAFWRYDGDEWIMVGTAEFTTSQARSAAISAPVSGMKSHIDGERFDREYLNGEWRPYGAAMFPISPTTVVGGVRGPQGSVSFTASTGISLVGIPDFDNYHLSISSQGTIYAELRILMRQDGENRTDTKYQFTYGETPVAGDFMRRSSLDAPEGRIGNVGTGERGDLTLDLFGLNRAEPTRWISQSHDAALTHLVGGGRYASDDLFTGFTIKPNAGTISGKLNLYGWNEQ